MSSCLVLSSNLISWRASLLSKILYQIWWTVIWQLTSLNYSNSCQPIRFLHSFLKSSILSRRWTNYDRLWCSNLWTESDKNEIRIVYLRQLMSLLVILALDFVGFVPFPHIRGLGGQFLCPALLRCKLLRSSNQYLVFLIELRDFSTHASSIELTFVRFAGSIMGPIAP